MNHRVEHCPACRSLDLRVDRVGVWGTSDLLACNTCRTQFLSPQPDDSRLAEIYGEDYYVPWGVETAEAIDAMKRMTFEPMLAACEPGPGRTVLDLGCATGSFLAEAARRGATTYGIDLNARCDRGGAGARARSAAARRDRRRPSLRRRELRRGRDDRLHRARPRPRGGARGRPHDRPTRARAW